MDDLTFRRQRRCAERREGHDFDGPNDTGTCRDCGLVVQS